MKSDRQQLWWRRRPAQAFLCWVSWMRRRLEHYSEQQAVLAQREARGVLRFFLLLGNFPAFHHVKVGAKSPTFPTLFGPTLIHPETPTSWSSKKISWKVCWSAAFDPGVKQQRWEKAEPKICHLVWWQRFPLTGPTPNRRFSRLNKPTKSPILKGKWCFSLWLQYVPC